MKYLFSIIVFFFLSNFASAQCLDNTHSPFENQGWLSCNKSQNPNAIRGESHWIQYDLGATYPLASMHLWNYNVWGETTKGVKEIAIDYSKDGSTWTAFGMVEVEKAPGSWKYQGAKATDFNNIEAQYVLITVLNTWDNSSDCAGFAEVRFDLSNSVSTQTEISTQMDWSIAPNPASDYLMIEFPDQMEIQQISLHNSTGMLIRELTISTQNAIQLPTSDLKDGIYALSLHGERGVFTRRFVKAK